MSNGIAIVVPVAYVLELADFITVSSHDDPFFHLLKMAKTIKAESIIIDSYACQILEDALERKNRYDEMNDLRTI